MTQGPSPRIATAVRSYAQGFATRWPAQRVRPEFPAFDPAAALDGGAPLLFTGEMIYPWMIEADPVLRPLREVAGLLAGRDAWPMLYDPIRLGANDVPVAAAVHFGGMYVDRDDSLRTAGQLAAESGRHHERCRRGTATDGRPARRGSQDGPG